MRKISLNNKMLFKNALNRAKKYGLDYEFKSSYKKARSGKQNKNKKKQNIKTSIANALWEWDI